MHMFADEIQIYDDLIAKISHCRCAHYVYVCTREINTFTKQELQIKLKRCVHALHFCIDL